MPNVIVADYSELNGDAGLEIEEMLRINRAYRDKIEHKISEKISLEICARRPKNDEDADRMLKSGYEMTRHMGWEAVVQNYVLKSLKKAVKKRHARIMAAV